MELLKFNDAPKNTRRGKNPAGFIGAGIMVAVMGLSSTLAGTITLNAGQTVEFGQGVVNTAACDSSIKLTPTSSFDGDTFTVSGLTIEQIGLSTSDEGRGCKGQVLEVRAYSGTTISPFFTDTASTRVMTIFIADTDTAGYFETNTALYKVRFYDLSNEGVVQFSNQASASVSLAGSVPTTTDDSSTVGVKIAITQLKLSPTITKFTVESRAPRTSISSPES